MLAIFFIAFTFIDYGEAKGQCVPGANYLPVTIPTENCIWTMMVCFSCDLTGTNPISFVQVSAATSTPSPCSDAAPSPEAWEEKILQVYEQNCTIPPCSIGTQTVNIRLKKCVYKKRISPTEVIVLLCPDPECVSIYEVCFDNTMVPPQLRTTYINTFQYGDGDCSQVVPEDHEVTDESDCYELFLGQCGL